MLQSDLEFLKIIATQTGIAIYQAELYEKIKMQAERERISRNIIEILRNSIDKSTIKKLFVKNIGKFFNADRVFFSEYNSETKSYLPVDANSEYLSSDKEKSFIGVDWTNMYSHLHPLLEKRELKIQDWGKYVSENPDKGDEFYALYGNANVKSSYSFPVLHQDKIMGYFCIEFTNRFYVLLEEDISRIRSICAQAGIALYHAELYLNAQKFSCSRSEIISEISEMIENPTNNILEVSKLLRENEFERSMQIEYLNNIINSCSELLDLTRDIK